MNFARFLIPIVFAGVLSDVNAELKITAPTLEMTGKPLCVEIKKPRFSWKLESDQKGVVQTSYHIRVAENPESLSNKNGTGIGADERGGQDSCQNS